MQDYISKYYNIDEFGDSWSKEELIPALKFLESAEVKVLQEIITNLGIKFEGGNESVNDPEELISVLFHDAGKEDVKKEIEKFKNK